MAKVLVTGATGFIGNHVIRQLLGEHEQVIATSSGAEKARQMEWYGEVQYIPFDMSAFDPSVDYFSYFGKPDKMIHLAWQGLPNYKAAFHLEQNFPLHLAFLKNLLQNGLTDLSVTGTCFEYGMQEGELSETMPVFPANPYAQAKDELRKSLENLPLDFSFKWVRLFYMYGEGQSPKSLLSQLDSALKAGEPVFNMSGGEQTRDYLPIEKMAGYIVKIALQHNVTGIINCCSGEPVTVKQLVEAYLAKSGKKIELNLGYYPYPDYEPMHFWGSTKKLRSVVG